MRSRLILTILLFIFILCYVVTPSLCQSVEKGNGTSDIYPVETTYTELESHLSFYVGIASLILGFIAYISSKKSESKFVNKLGELEKPMKVLEDIIDAEETIKKQQKETEETRSRNEALKKEKFELLEQLKSLDRSIKEMPNEAKKVFLEERAKEDEKLLLQIYNSVRSTRNQLKNMEGSSLVSEEIKGIIEKEIKPKYYFENRINSLKDTLLMLTLCAGILTSIIPYPLSSVISMPFYIVSLFYLIELIRTYLRQDDPLARASLCRKAHQMSFAFSGLLLILLLMSFSNSIIFHILYFDDLLYALNKLSGLFLLLICISAFIGIVYYKEYRKLINRPLTVLPLNFINESVGSFIQGFRKKL